MNTYNVGLVSTSGKKLSVRVNAETAGAAVHEARIIAGYNKLACAPGSVTQREDNPEWFAKMFGEFIA